MKKLTHAFLFISLLIATSLSHAAPLIVVLGERHSLKTSLKRLWISDPKSLRAEPTSGGFMLIPKKAGVVDIRLGDQLEQVYIWKPQAIRTQQALEQAVKKIPGLNIQPGEFAPLLLGRVYRLSDLDRMIETLPNDALWQMRADLPRQDFQKWASEKMQKAGITAHPITFEPSPHVTLKKHSELTERILSRLGLAIEIDNDSVDPAPVVRVEIIVAEVRKDDAASFGFLSSDSYQSHVLPGGAKFDSNFQFRISALESQGHARLLARPNLICRSGASAEFLAGGEFPIRTSTKKESQIIWKNYGILLKVKPIADRSGRISLQIETEVSTIDGSRSVEGIPGFLTNRVSSQFDLIGPQTIALSGLLRHEDSASRSGILGLSSLPILGPLFSSREWRENKSELVIFVRPEILHEGTP